MFNEFNKMLIGSDKMFDRLRELSETATKVVNYPPYSIKKLDDNRYTIEMAVAGFGKNEIDVVVDDKKLVITGNIQNKEDEGEYLFQGLAHRPFTRNFELTDSVEVKSCELFNGILKVFLETFIPESKKPKLIEINEKTEK